MNRKVALVTGGVGGIGTAICRRLADLGHKVATNYRSEERARPWQERMRAEGYEVALVKGDVTSPTEAEAILAKSCDFVVIWALIASVSLLLTAA